MKNTKELKPCRVCNVQPEYRHYGEKCWNECPNCECQPWPMSDSYEEADDAWNKLQTPELPEGYREEKIFVKGPVHLYRGGRVVARRYETGELGIPARTLGAKDAQALTIFLQRRNHENA